jgi:hypothetical protein
VITLAGTAYMVFLELIGGAGGLVLVGLGVRLALTGRKDESGMAISGGGA